MKINSIQQANVSYTGKNLFSKIKNLLSKPSQDTFVKAEKPKNEKAKYKTPAVSKQVEEEKLDYDNKQNANRKQDVEQVVVNQKSDININPNVQRMADLTPEQIEEIKVKQREKSFEEYFKDYFKKVHLGKSTDGYCQLLEERLLKNGVKVTFENSALTAKKIYQTVIEMQNRGIKVPKEIILMTPIDDDLLGFTPTTKEGLEEFAPVFIKKGIRDDNANISKALQNLGFRHYTDETARGTIIHEIAHYNHLPIMLDESESMQIWKNHFPNFEDEFEFGKKVSAHAIIDKTGAEFVAEVFTGLVNGETFDDEVMTLYKELKGPVVPPPPYKIYT